MLCSCDVSPHPWRFFERYRIIPVFLHVTVFIINFLWLMMQKRVLCILTLHDLLRDMNEMICILLWCGTCTCYFSVIFFPNPGCVTNIEVGFFLHMAPNLQLNSKLLAINRGVPQRSSLDSQCWLFPHQQSQFSSLYLYADDTLVFNELL